MKNIFSSWNKISPKTKKAIIAVVVLIIVAVILNKNWYKITYAISGGKINIEDGETLNISAERKVQIEGIAQQLHSDIEDTPFLGHDYSPYQVALTLTDNELKYLAKFYLRNLSRGEKLYDAINSDVYTTGSNITSDLMSRLTAIGQA